VPAQPLNPKQPFKLSYTTLKHHTVTVAELAHAIDVPASKIRLLMDAGYLCAIPVVTAEGARYQKIAKGSPGKPVPLLVRVVDRVSILLWLLDIDLGKRVPAFNKYIEMEIMRIAKLPDPIKTEQAVRLLLRYRDAETLAAAIMRAGAAGIENVERLRKNKKLKRAIRRLAGIEQRENRRQAQAQTQTH
jgi:hypothetical protein